MPDAPAALPVEPAIEPVVEPGLRIVDPHHHLWDRRGPLGETGAPLHPFDEALALAPRYLLDEFVADLCSGHDVCATVFVECRSMYRADAPPELAPVGETEFVNGVAAMAASGLYGPVRVAAGIVGHADLRLGERVAPVLEAHLRASGRFRGIRHSAPWDADPAVLGPLARSPAGLYRDSTFRAGFARLAPLGLSFDAWLLEPQIDDLADLAAAFPDTQVVLDHMGTPLGTGAYAGRRESRFDAWRGAIGRLAERPNVVVKLGGLAMPFCGFDREPRGGAPLSQTLADAWRPYVETCIDAFGAGRCMFESNFPVDLYSCSYRTLWNALKRTAAGASAAEKAELFSGTATRVYRLDG